MIPAAILVGLVAQVVAWHLVVTERHSVWTLMTATFAACGVLALLVGEPRPADRVEVSVAVAAGLGVGLALYLATRIFVALVRSWDAFGRQASSMYARRLAVPLPLALGLSVGVMVVGEELFWRGLVQPWLAEDLGWPTAGVLTWLASVGANLPIRNLAIVGGAVVGGAVWAGLAVWTEGMLASLCSHALWTALMIALPPTLRPGAR